MSLVLVVDDEEALLEVLCEAVTGLGHECLRAVDGEAALAAARARRPDLVVSDHMMPRRTGLELARALRDDPALSTVPVILMSAVRPRGIDDGWRFLAKPVALVDFERAIADALGLPPRPRAERPQVDAGLLDEVLDWMGHDLKTPLHTAQLAAQLLQKRLPPGADPRDREGIEVIVRQLARLSAVVAGAHDAARLAGGRLELSLERLELRGWLEGRAREWRARWPSAALEVAPAPSVVVSADPARLGQALDALVANAVKHGGGGAQVVVEVTPAAVTIAVHDRGPGIRAAELPALLDRFQRRPPPGQGLGLYLAASLLRLHGGSLAVASPPGGGATFTVTLPRAADVASA